VLYAEQKNRKLGKRLRFSLVSNLTLIDSVMIGFIKEHRIGLCTSLDGPAQVHDKNRKYIDCRPTHADVVRSIGMVKKSMQLEALMVTTRHSLAFAKEIVDEYVRLGFRQMQIRPFLHLGSARKNMSELSYTADEYIVFWKSALDRILEVNRERLFPERFTSHLLRKLITKQSTKFVDLCSPCGAAVSTLAYGPKGDIFSCDEGRQYDLFRLGDVSMKMHELFEKEQTQALIRSSVNDCTLCDACVWKPYCGLCPVCTYAERGNLIPLLSRDDRCKILDAQFSHLMALLIEGKHTETFMTWIRNI
jgi:uncharacterized protein